ncbi:MAG: monofunctional biosynthetic peptidoglycan transglycosylase [Bacteroidetes bacterium]|nr:monofunctional biosynthetic peptidoglycan transglycosylase [Bacteroidota bacterium]
MVFRYQELQMYMLNAHGWIILFIFAFLFMLSKIKSFIYSLFIIVFQITFIVILLYRVVPVPYTPLMLQRSMESTNPDFEIRNKWVSINTMSKQMPLLAVTGEDPKFFNHYGFDLEQIQKSIEKNLEKGKQLRGASTISQQTAKNIFLLPTRSFIRKGFEVPLTLLLEAFWNKKRILEVYLNIIEMGDGLFGIEATSQFYYKKSASKLTAAECAAIVTTFPSPRKRNPKALNGPLRRHQQMLLNYKSYIDTKNFWWNKSSNK